MHSHLKIGIIQNAPLTADFSNNLRAIVQGYRDCLDHGAQLVVAPATALCGHRPGSLSSRHSFLRQTQSALESLSLELGHAPLLLGAYTSLFEDEVDEWELLMNDGGVEGGCCSPQANSHPDIVPFLIEKETVTELPDSGVTDINGLAVYVDVSIGAVVPDKANFDILIHLSDGSWHAGAAARQEDIHRWEARNNGTPVICVQAVGTAEGHIYAGGSAVYGADGTPLLRLPFFETGHRVADLAAAPRARALPREDELLEQALIRGIRDSVLGNGYNAVCLPLDHPNAALLTALCTEALGSANVYGATFGKAEDCPASSLGIKMEELDAAPLLSAAHAAPGTPLALRLQAAMLTTYADNQGLMLLSPLSRHDIMLGQFTLYAESCGMLAPLGNLYRMDIHLLTQLAGERHPGLIGTLAEPEQPEQDRIIHELADRNISPTELLVNHPMLFPENDVRYVQRRLIASALKRTQLPTILHVDAPSEQLEIPVSHRLND